MADQKLTQLTQATTPLTGTEQAYVVQSSASKRTTTQDIANLAPGTDLTFTQSTRVLASSTGADVTLPVATDALPGLMAAADKAKLDGVAAGATANSSDATLLNRANHTGTQAAGTITGLATVAMSGSYADLSNKPSLGTAAAANTGTAAGNVVVLDGSARLPAVDGSQLTGINATTDLGYTASTRVLTSSTGADVTLPLATTSDPGLMAAADKTKLDGIAAGAEVNVNADWNAGSGDAQILNKPSLGSLAALSTVSDAEIAANAEIAVSKLADGAARQLLQTDAAGTGVEWTSNVDIPGTLDVTQAATFDSTLSFPLGASGTPSIYPGSDTNTGLWSPAADTVAISTNGMERVRVGNTETKLTNDLNLDDGGSFTTTLQTITPTANRTLSLPDATGTVALVAGSSGQIIYNNAGALGGTTSTWDSTNGTRYILPFGYGTGAGGTVTQATNKSTGVTLNTRCGQITLNSAELAADTAVSFTLTNSSIAATDVLILNHVSAGTFGAYNLNARCAAGSATINVRNLTAGALSEAIVLSFAVIKAVTA